MQYLVQTIEPGKNIANQLLKCNCYSANPSNVIVGREKLFVWRITNDNVAKNLLVCSVFRGKNIHS